MEQERIYGTVFFPETPEIKISGAWLTISSTAILIEITYDFFKDETWPIVLGDFNGLDKVTFVNCRNDGGSHGAGGAFTRIRASYCIKGAHFKKYSDLNFKRVTMLSPALSDWIISNDIIDLDNGTYQVPSHEEIVRCNINGIEVLINSAHRTHTAYGKLNVTKICTVSLISEALVDIDSLSTMMTRIKKFILFLTNKNPEFDEYYLITEDGSENELINTKDKLRDDRFTQAINIHFFLAKKFLNESIEKWFGHRELYPVIDLILEKNFNTEMSMHGLFLNMCVALESFHIRFGKDGKEIIDPSKEINRERISKMIECDSELLAWFKEQSAYWKNPTLKDRLNQFREIIMRIKDDSLAIGVDELIAKIVKTRNDMAHSGEPTKRFNYVELFLVAKIIEYTIRLEILQLIGFDINEKNNSLLENAKRSIEILARLNKIKEL